MIYTDNTKKALKLCFEAHKNQVDKSGMPYVFHPFHLAEQMKTEETTIVALLHDLVEDTDYTLENFLDDTLTHAGRIVDASKGVNLLTSHSHCDHEHHHKESETDPHIWLSAENSALMAKNIFDALCQTYPQHAKTFTDNYVSLASDLKRLDEYGKEIFEKGGI